ncbi:MAG: GNAT family N-acetyltransferase [Calditrichaeota bacterium]|nr:MAG: GNAT family N-acetyltransferase [Calditrichota bacterium]
MTSPDSLREICPATEEDLPSILALLRRCHLPPDDLERHIRTTIVARHESRVVGCAALEMYPPWALLRSVAVEETFRGQGLGVRLTQEALHLAQQQGITGVYLLTETAESFFARLGFQPVSREEVPPAVKASVEFTHVCPVSARVMMKGV